MQNILGLSFFFHDSAAALIRDGNVVAAAAEERFSRKKHDSSFPSNAISYCIQVSGLLDINQLDAIVFYEKPVAKLFRATQSLVSAWPRGMGAFVSRFPEFLSNKVDIKGVIETELPAFRGKILFSEHHLSHAASAFFCSPFDEAAILTVDGVGEYETTAIGVGKGQEIQILESIRFPHSIGLYYSALTAYLGFEVNEGEWKVMGLAPYGKDTYSEKLLQLFNIYSDGSFTLNMRYFRHAYAVTGAGFNKDSWQELLGLDPRDAESDLGEEYLNLACSGQCILELLMEGLARRAREITGLGNLVMAGGVALNGVANWKIWKAKLFDDIWVQPASGDDGGSIGAALAVSNMFNKSSRTCELKDIFLGPEFPEQRCRKALQEHKLIFQDLREEEMLKYVAGAIAEGKVVGWFQGRMEFGPRALGSRSILANPCLANIKETINKKIKYREGFRPFAPAVIDSFGSKYFEIPKGRTFPFMVEVVNVRPEYRDDLPGITHEGGTARVQTVTAESNKIFFELLEHVDEEIGVPIVLNTSFNVRGEPIVCTPEDAIRTFLKTEMDLLVLGNLVVEREAIAGRHEQLKSPVSDENDPSDDSGPSIEDTVLEFYQELPFNVFSNDVKYAARLAKRNIIKKEYRPVHELLKREQFSQILDVGCGSGWFSNSCSFHYGCEVTGVDMNPVVLSQAKTVRTFLGIESLASFQEENVFSYQPDHRFDLVNSLGVLHHTDDCIGAVERCLEWVRALGYFHLGLYNSYMRRPFLRYFSEMKDRGASEQEMYQKFISMVPGMSEGMHAKSWFRDQVLHPHETTHTYAEIYEVVSDHGFRLVGTSLARKLKGLSLNDLQEIEKRYEKKNAELIFKKGRYVPGFFTILALKEN